MDRMKLLIPGPVEVNQETLLKMASPIRPHYGKEWAEFYNGTIELTKKVFQTKGDVFLIVGSGTAGLDAAIGSMIGRERKALVLTNGFFGDRLRSIAKSYCADNRLEVVRFELGDPIYPSMVEDFLKREKDIQVVITTHCETSTGVLNPIKELGEVCKRNDAVLVVDAVSSLGGAELKMDKWDIGICVSASQKCLEAPPGLSPVAVSEKAWSLINENSIPGWYLNLKNWKEYAVESFDRHPHPTTMAVNNVLAFRRSIEKILNEGLERRFKRHEEAASLLREGLRSLEFEIFAKKGYSSSTVTAVKVNSRISDSTLRKFLREKHGIMIARGMGELIGKTFRIGHMGPSATVERVTFVLRAIEEVLKSSGSTFQK